MIRIVLGLVAVVVIAALAFAAPVVWGRPWTPDLFYMRVFAGFAIGHPELLTQLGMLDGTPFRWYATRLDDYSVAFARREARFVERSLATLRGYDRSRMTPSARLSADVMEWFLADQQARARDFAFHDYPVNQLFGVQSNLPAFMIGVHPLRKPRDARDYVVRVGRIETALHQVIEQLAVRESLGVIPPRFVLHRVLEEMNAFVGHPPRENPLHATFAAKTDTLPRLADRDRDRLLAELERTIATSVYPAYRELIAVCEHLASRATDDDGVWKLPNGAAYYAHRLRSSTTTALPADSLHALGLAETARIQEEMRAVLRRLGRPVAPFGAAVNAALGDPRFAFAPGDSGREQILAGYRAILADAETRAAPLFDVRPRAGLEVRRVPEFREAGSAGAYYSAPSLDGSRPGVFYANLRDPAETKRGGMRTLAYHEGIPGHHLQQAIAQETRGLPFFRQVIPFTAYDEGWALYAERLALEHGFHQNAWDSLGAYGAELMRAARLVVDTGIHHQRWTRRQAIDWMVAHTGLDSTRVAREVERYIVAPGQACAYTVGQLAILAMRERARQRLGDRFDLRRFHNVVLTNGALPLALLERTVEEWVRAERRAAGLEERG